jgi:hypothetical protein
LRGDPSRREYQGAARCPEPPKDPHDMWVLPSPEDLIARRDQTGSVFWAWCRAMRDMPGTAIQIKDNRSVSVILCLEYLSGLSAEQLATEKWRICKVDVRSDYLDLVKGELSPAFKMAGLIVMSLPSGFERAPIDDATYPEAQSVGYIAGCSPTLALQNSGHYKGALCSISTAVQTVMATATKTWRVVSSPMPTGSRLDPSSPLGRCLLRAQVSILVTGKSLIKAITTLHPLYDVVALEKKTEKMKQLSDTLMTRLVNGYKNGNPNWDCAFEFAVEMGQHDAVEGDFGSAKELIACMLSSSNNAQVLARAAQLRAPASVFAVVITGLQEDARLLRVQKETLAFKMQGAAGGGKPYIARQVQMTQTTDTLIRSNPLDTKKNTTPTRSIPSLSAGGKSLEQTKHAPRLKELKAAMGASDQLRTRSSMHGSRL